MKEFKNSFLDNKMEKLKLPNLNEMIGVGKVYFKSGLENSGLNKVVIDGIKTTLPIIGEEVVKKVFQEIPKRFPDIEKMFPEIPDGGSKNPWIISTTKGDMGETIWKRYDDLSRGKIEPLSGPIVIEALSNLKQLKPMGIAIKNKIGELIKFNKIESKIKGCPLEGSIGKWEGERGRSKLIIDREKIPQNPRFNPDGKTFGELLDKYGASNKIKFKDGEPDFSDVAKVKVKIDNFTDNRYGKGGNFDQAREMAAKKMGMTQSELKDWMKENKYTFHEAGDCKTMLLVPNEIHGNISHAGGVSKYKKSVA